MSRTSEKWRQGLGPASCSVQNPQGQAAGILTENGELLTFPAIILRMGAWEKLIFLSAFVS
jgi:hypothetical protein